MSTPEMSMNEPKSKMEAQYVLNDPFVEDLNDQIKQTIQSQTNTESETIIFNRKPLIGLADIVSGSRPVLDMLINKIDPQKHPTARSIGKGVVMLTDTLDGMVARADNGKFASRLGDIADPIADHVSNWINFKDAEKQGAIRKGISTIIGVRDAAVDATRLLHRLLGTELGQMNAQRMKNDRSEKKSRRQKIEDSAFMVAKTSVGILAPKYPKAANVMAHVSLLYSLKRGYDFFNNTRHLEIFANIRDRAINGFKSLTH